MAGGAHTLVRNVSSGAVAAIAAWSSYSHMVHLAVRHGERAEVAWALPFSVDGMLIVSTIVMVDDKRHGHRVRPMARLAFTIGVIASIAANIAAAHPTPSARIIAAWPAIALLLVVEMLARPPAAAFASVQPPAELPTTAQQVPPRVEVPPLRQVPPLVQVEVPAAVPYRVEVPPLRQVPPQGSTRVEVPPARPLAPAAAAYPSPSVGRPVAQRRLRVAGTSPEAEVNERTHTPELPVAAHRRPTGQPAEPPPAELLPAAELPRLGPAAEVPAPAKLPPNAAAAEVPMSEGWSLAGAASAASTPETEPAGGSTVDQSAANKVTVAVSGRRPTAATRQLAQTIMAAEPHLSRNEVANRLGVSTRRLREVLAA
jgi:hypothetical protein